ncbi:MAG: polysaccharide biosynthesis/export family protein [Planctomycetes bacterium]|nr:polysaccharide biosynthesis/export family protein [Planctomycetota bacterium]
MTTNLTQISILLTLSGFLFSACGSVDPIGFESEYSDSENFRLFPGDVVQIVVSNVESKTTVEEKMFDVSQTVRPDGNISVPLAGDYNVSGDTIGDVRKELSKTIGASLGDNQIEVSMFLVEAKSQVVHVFGEVGMPGRYQYSGSQTIIDVLAMAGGFNRRASYDVSVVRQNEAMLAEGKSIEVDVSAIMYDGDQSRNFYLQPRDIIVAERSIGAIIEDFVVSLFSPVKGLLEGITQVLFGSTSLGWATSETSK